MPTSKSRGAAALFASAAPRSREHAARIGQQMFPTWRLALIAAPLVVLLTIGFFFVVGAVAFVVALCVMAHVYDHQLVVGAAAVGVAGFVFALAIIVRSLRRDRAQFTTLVRDGALVDARSNDFRAPHWLATMPGFERTLERVLRGAGRRIVASCRAPVFVGDLDGLGTHARAPAGVTPTQMIVHRNVPYVAFIGPDDNVVVNRVLQRDWPR